MHIFLYLGNIKGHKQTQYKYNGETAVDSPHTRPVTRRIIHFDDFIIHETKSGSRQPWSMHIAVKNIVCGQGIILYGIDLTAGWKHGLISQMVY